MITDIEQETSDIEWFFTNGKEIGFVTSSAGKLPISVANKSMEEIAFLTAYFSDLPYRSSLTINPDLKALLSPCTISREYLSDFTKMTERGLFSFDKTAFNNFSDPNYHLVAKPLNPLRFEDLPLEIAEVLFKTKVNGEIGTSLNICLIG
ncbi:hypothetical protein HDF18_21815 [Mucilaginibacter sp. X5P1]|uniref:hypothetical protein n=1 Tax=Mucilaginibacter sp. X5P1 TaxID=2723088 RepID=UPI0016146C40|nr:hypothetical protein [Mucilaginibacter sp. X5P1]MBB6140253.1 hypothetical protein [Mucilaginibacter sp. X5P1]